MRHQKSRFLILVSLVMAIAATAAADPALFKIKVTAEVANIRVKPFIGSNIVRQFPEGTVLEAERKEGEWYLVKIEPDEAGAISGYVHESLVQALEEIPVEKEAPAVEKVSPPVIPPATPPVAEKLPLKDEKKPESKPAEPVLEKPAVYKLTKEILAEAEAEKPTFVSFWGGGGLMAVGDLNGGAEGLADYYASQLNRTADRTVAPARAGYQFGGEVGFPIARAFKIAVGAEYLKTARESALTYPGEGEVIPSLTVKPEISALPVRVSLIYYPQRSLYLRLGVEYFFARAKYHCAFADGDTLRDWQGEASSGGAGLCGGIGFDLSLGRGFFLTAEVNGRYAKISGFSGTNSYLDEALAEAYIEKGRLYTYEVRTSGGTAYSLVFVRDKTPAESGVENAKEAVVDLSGIALRIGFKFKF
ncbi:MAG: SH3 domain-containing protein [Candidatus Aminicenantales bacterium]